MVRVVVHAKDVEPLRHGSFAFTLWSHTVSRWCGLALLLAILVLNLALLGRHPIDWATLVGQLQF